MPSIIACRSAQPWRIAVALDTTPSTTASDYTITRTDGVATLIAVALVFLPGTNTAELALSGPLLEGVVYQVAVSGAGSAQVAYRTPATAPANDPAERQHLEERLGLDLAWCSTGALDSRGQVPRRTGIEALKHDLAALCLLEPTELFHRPQAGVGLARFTNANDEAQDEAAGLVQSAWTKDPRVATGSAVVIPEMDHETGELSISGQVLVSATGETIDVSSANFQG